MLTVILFVATESIFLSLPISSDTDIQYFLSAISQALAALFALVFTIVLVVSQMASVHSHRLMDLVFGRKTKAYMTLFAFAVIIPFIALRTSYLRMTLVQVSGTLAIGCILYLIPFMLTVKENLKIESVILNLSRRSVDKIKSNLKGEYDEYLLSKKEEKVFLEEIRIIDNIALSAWNRKDYDTFQVAIERLLWILSEIKNWHTIERIRIRLEDIGRIVVKDARATNIVLDSIRDILPVISENERGYPLKELLLDYRSFSIHIAQEGLAVSSSHSLKNYYQIGEEILNRKNEGLATSLLKDFYDILSKTNHEKLPDKGNILVNIGAIGPKFTKIGFKTTTEIFLQIILSNSFLERLLTPPSRILDTIEEEARKRQWKEITNFCQEIKKKRGKN